MYVCVSIQRMANATLIFTCHLQPLKLVAFLYKPFAWSRTTLTHTKSPTKIVVNICLTHTLII